MAKKLWQRNKGSILDLNVIKLTVFNLCGKVNKKNDIRLLEHGHDAGDREKLLSKIWAKTYSKINDGNEPILNFLLKYRGIFPILAAYLLICLSKPSFY